MNDPMIHQHQPRGGRAAWLRSVCLIGVTLLLLTSCIGCTSFATSDEVAALKNQLASATHEIDLLKSRDDAAQQEIESLNSRHEAEQREINALKSAKESAQQEIDALKSSNKAAQDEINTLKNSNQAAQQEINALKASNTAAQQKIDALKTSSSAAQEEIDALQSSNQAAQEKIETLQSSNAEMQAEIDRLKEQIRELQGNSTPDDKPTEPTEKIKIYIDQGHNPTSYHNAGASGNGLYEQDLTFEIGCLLATLLENDGRFEIALSRPTADTVLGTDNNTSLAARVQGAQDFGADYFISLHINSFETDSANGIEVYTALQEGVSYDFGNSILQGMVASTGLRDRGMKPGPELHVLKNATMPAVLLEMGFISNATDAALLSESPELFAEGIYDGILAYFELTESTASVN